MMKALLILY